jgi:hypothetical protein
MTVVAEEVAVELVRPEVLAAQTLGVTVEIQRYKAPLKVVL